MRWVPGGERLVSGVVFLDLEATVEICDVDTQLPARVAELVEQGQRKVVLNLEGVSSIDSSGLGGLLRAYAHVVRRGGDFGLVHVAPRIRGVLETTRLITVIQVFESEAQAIASMNSQPPTPNSQTQLH